MKLALVFLFAIIIVNSSRALGDTPSFYGEPQYEIKTQTSDTTLDSGSQFRMELFITGAGDVNFSRIFVSIPQYIVKNEKVKLTKLNYAWIDPKNRTIRGNPEVQEIAPSFYLLVPDIWYMLPAEKSNMYSTMPLVFGETSYLVMERKRLIQLISLLPIMPPPEIAT
jgi:hypothetical protein